MQNVILFCHIFGKSRQKLWFFSRLRFWICKNKTFLREYFYFLSCIPVVNVRTILTFGGRSLGIHEVAPFWWEFTKKISMASATMYSIYIKVAKSTILYTVYENQRKSLIKTMRAKRVLFTFFTLKMPKMVNLASFWKPKLEVKQCYQIGQLTLIVDH